MTASPFEVLHLSDGAGIDEARKSYITLSRKWHPDKCSDPIATERFQEINQAFCDITNSHVADTINYNPHVVDVSMNMRCVTIKLHNSIFSVCSDELKRKYTDAEHVDRGPNGMQIKLSDTSDDLPGTLSITLYSTTSTIHIQGNSSFLWIETVFPELHTIIKQSEAYRRLNETQQPICKTEKKRYNLRETHKLPNRFSEHNIYLPQPKDIQRASTASTSLVDQVFIQPNTPTLLPLSERVVTRDETLVKQAVIDGTPTEIELSIIENMAQLHSNDMSVSETIGEITDDQSFLDSASPIFTTGASDSSLFGNLSPPSPNILSEIAEADRDVNSFIRRLLHTTESMPTTDDGLCHKILKLSDLDLLTKEMSAIKDMLAQLCPELLTISKREVVTQTVAIYPTVTDLDVSSGVVTTPQPPTLSTREVGTQTENIASTEVDVVSSVVAEPGMGVYLFRTWKDPLSCFFPCVLKTDYGVFRSAEHYYQFRHLSHHGMTAESEQCRKAKDAAKAKSIATTACPEHCTTWEAIEQEVMEYICQKKLEQCKEFRTCLKETGAKRLLHNMERDPRWGIGKDALGQNRLGVILEKLRNSFDDFQPSYPPTEVDPALPLNTRSEILVLGDSMISDIKVHLERIQSDPVEVKCTRGATIQELAKQLPSLATKVNTLVLHCGTNSLETSTKKDMERDYQALIDNIIWLTGCTKVIVSGLVHRLDNTSLNARIDAVNSFLHSLESEVVTFVNHNSTFRDLHRVLQRDGLHLKFNGSRQLAENIRLSLIGRSPVQATRSTQMVSSRTTERRRVKFDQQSVWKHSLSNNNEQQAVNSDHISQKSNRPYTPYQSSTSVRLPRSNSAPSITCPTAWEQPIIHTDGAVSASSRNVPLANHSNRSVHPVDGRPTTTTFDISQPPPPPTIQTGVSAQTTNFSSPWGISNSPPVRAATAPPQMNPYTELHQPAGFGFADIAHIPQPPPTTQSGGNHAICSDLIQNSTVYSVQPMWQHATYTNIPVMPMYEHNQTEVNPHWLPGMYWNTLTSPWGLV